MPAEVAQKIARALRRRRVEDLLRRSLLDDTPGSMADRPPAIDVLYPEAAPSISTGSGTQPPQTTHQPIDCAGLAIAQTDTCGARCHAGHAATRPWLTPSPRRYSATSARRSSHQRSSSMRVSSIMCLKNPCENRRESWPRGPPIRIPGRTSGTPRAPRPPHRLRRQPRKPLKGRSLNVANSASPRSVNKTNETLSKSTLGKERRQSRRIRGVARQWPRTIGGDPALEKLLARLSELRQSHHTTETAAASDFTDGQSRGYSGARDPRDG